MAETSTIAPAEPQRGAPASFSVTDLGMLCAVLFWGTNMTVSKLTFAAFPPLAFNAMRFLIAPTMLAVLALALEGSLAPPPGMQRRIIWLGLVGHVGYQIPYSLGLSLSTASNSALLFATTPVLVALIGWARGTERLTRRTWAGIALALCGVVLVLASRGLSLSGATLPGDLLLIAAVICWAAYTVGAGPLLQRCSPLRATALPMLYGAPFVVLAGVPQLLGMHWGGVGVAGWSGVLYSAVFSIVAAYWLWYGSIRRVGPTRTGVYTSLLPVIGVVAAWIGLGEPIVPAQIAGAAAILVGLWLTRQRPASAT